jgi:hypothetical protein
MTVSILLYLGILQLLILIFSRCRYAARVERLVTSYRSSALRASEFPLPRLGLPTLSGSLTDIDFSKLHHLS